MFASTAVSSVSSSVTDVRLEGTATTGYDEDRNVSTTVSPTPVWQVTPCGLTALNATVVDGSCSTADNASTSTAAPVAPCAVFVQPWALLLLAFPVMTVFGNVLVCLSVYRERNLRTATNFFIVSLAIADLMVAILVMPLAVYVEVCIEIPSPKHHFVSYLDPGNQRVCLSVRLSDIQTYRHAVCLCVRWHISNTTIPKLVTKFSVHVTCGRVSVLF